MWLKKFCMNLDAVIVLDREAVVSPPSPEAQMILRFPSPIFIVIPTHQGFELFQNYPNPFNPVTNITYTLAKASTVELSIFNPLGQLLTTLVSERQAAGRYTYQWNANKHAGGVYICRLTAGQLQKTMKVVLMK